MIWQRILRITNWTTRACPPMQVLASGASYSICQDPWLAMQTALRPLELLFLCECFAYGFQPLLGSSQKHGYCELLPLIGRRGSVGRHRKPLYS